MSNDETQKKFEQTAEIWAMFPAHYREYLARECLRCETPEEFYASVAIGPCPKCGNRLTVDGDDADPEGEMGDATVGVCPKCHYQWCLECGAELKEWPCPHWDAWDSHCKRLGIFQRPEAELEEGWIDAYTEWLCIYIQCMQMRS